MPRTLARMSTSKRVIVAAPRGYCAGVDRAVTTVEKALETYGPPVYVRKQIVHNKHVVSTLEKRGAIFVDELDEVPADALVVFSAHGVSPAVREEAARRELRTIDATCPLVTKVHREAKRFAAKDTDILLIGHAGHAEVDRLDLPTDKPLVWLSQTTLSVDETMETVTRLRQRFPLLVSPPTDDICYATQNRQQAVKQIAPHCDLMIVVGSRNSSNSMRLVEVALEAGAKRSERIDYPHEIRDEWLDGVSTIGLTSGASVPDELVQGALALLRERGFPKADEERLIEENLTFALPPELRRDLGGEDQRRSRRHPGRRGDEAAKKHEPLDVGAD